MSIARLVRVLVAAGVFYAAMVLLFYLAQDKLIFLPRPLGAPPAPPSRDWSMEPYHVQASDGVLLRGWLVKPAQRPDALVIYYGGNAEEVSYLAQLADRYGGAALLLMNYRGYGASEGKPSERALFADALAIFDDCTHAGRFTPREIIVHGRSLGTGVAVHVASRRAVRAVILTSPYDSFTALGRRHYPFLPIAMLLRHPFNSLELAPRITAPALFLAGSADGTIPPEHSRRLHDAWAGPKQWRTLPADHNDISEPDSYWDAIAVFARAAHSP